MPLSGLPALLCGPEERSSADRQIGHHMSVARRAFLSTSGLGAAAVGVAALTAVPALSSTAGATSDTAPTLPGAAALSGSLVAFISDVRAAEVSLMVGEEEIVVQDKELVGRLLRAATR